jgi:hypothetical protein
MAGKIEDMSDNERVQKLVRLDALRARVSLKLKEAEAWLQRTENEVSLKALWADLDAAIQELPVPEKDD